MRNAIIFLGVCIAFAGIVGLALISGGGGGQQIQPNTTGMSSDVTASTTTSTDAAGNPNAFLPGGSSSDTAPSLAANGSGANPGVFQSSFDTPPVRWSQGNDNFSITGASLDGNELTLLLTVQPGGAAHCIPISLRYVTDESGDLAPPDTQDFTFPDSGNCQGSPAATYTDQAVVFTVNPPAPFLFTTYGSSNTFFLVATTTNNGVSVELPGTSG
ncbi:MAG TPA: hypothetical protein VNG29_03280 [Candidatus Paceibacterota bacterium]|nr:hypothetical protein [Candidatus Paceibacterota bacterium]